MRATLCSFVLACLLVAVGVQAAPGDVAIPAPLVPWVPWVLHGNEDALCPQAGAVPLCVWPGPLSLVVDTSSASFEQHVVVDSGERLVVLPGGGPLWPLDVKVDGRPAVVRDGPGPAVALGAGTHVVTGRFAFAVVPESLPVPETTALLRLVVHGKDVAFPRREGPVVYLDQQRQGDDDGHEEDSLDVGVFRKIVDRAPLLIETRYMLDVAGRAREVRLPGALLDGFDAASVGGALPLRMEGRDLRVQVKAGNWVVVVVGRRAHKPDARRDVFVAPAAFAGGPAEEVWVHEALPSLRTAHVDGVNTIAADQTRLPDEWRSLPAYRVQPGETLTLVEDRRGSADVRGSELQLTRSLWLDFDGQGAVVQDHVQGTFSGQRLEMGPDAVLGHVEVAGKDAFITTLGPAGRPGVEVRQRQLDVVAESRIDHSLAHFNAVGFAHDMQSAHIELHLPPGHRLVHASGVDDVSDTWVKCWSLFEIFLVVVLSAAGLRLWGPVVGALLATALVLTLQEPATPVGGIVVVIVLAALHRALPESLQASGWARGLRVARLVVAAGVGLAVVDGAITDVRVGMYPSQAMPWAQLGSGNPALSGKMGAKLRPHTADTGLAEETIQQAMQQASDKPTERGELDASKAGWSSSLGQDKDGYLDGDRRGGKQRQAQLMVIDPDAVVQTGPGLPRWQWTTVTLAFSGPVQHDQEIDLVILGPDLNLLWALVRVLLSALVVAVAFGLPGRRWPPLLSRSFRGRGALWSAVVVAALFGAPGAQAEVPPDDMLETLRERLMAPPACGASCVHIATVAAAATPSSLRLTLTVHAAAAAAVPVPFDDDQWSPRIILVDGRPAGAGLVAGVVHVAVAAGIHDVVLEGPLPHRDTVQIALPLLPKRGVFTSSAWSIDGIRADGSVDANLQLSRTERHADPGDKELAPSVLPPFLLVQRRLSLGLVFEVDTVVLRESPLGTPIVVDVPLLPGENVTTDGVRVERRADGAGTLAKVSLGPTERSVQWHSTLNQDPTITLTAPAGVPFLESWEIVDSPLWHVEVQGIPPVHQTDGDESRVHRPWPKETLTLTLTRPTGVAGASVTIDAVDAVITPGLRSTDATWTLSIRSSRGAQHPLRLPAGAEVLATTINGVPSPLAAVDGLLTVPLSPGEQQIEIKVRLPDGVAAMTTSPTLDVGQPASNVTTTLQLSPDRWVLFCLGNRAGPAVLFWSYLVVIVGCSLVLARVPVSPLKAHHWVLLSLGLTQVPLIMAALVALWLLALGLRREPLLAEPGRVSERLFNLQQLGLLALTAIALLSLFTSIHSGLLGQPDMQISGNGSSGGTLRWFADRSPSTLPVVRAWSLPLFVYRLAMLGWSLWLALALLRWLRDGFGAFGLGGYRRSPPPPPAPPTAAAVSMGTTRATTTTTTPTPGADGVILPATPAAISASDPDPKM